VKNDMDGTVHKDVKGGVVFVPLIGKYGFRDGWMCSLIAFGPSRATLQ
jgi:hypothetical protein